MGLPGAGTSTFADGLAAQGYHRLNRDAAGGRLHDLLPALDAVLASDTSRVVLDNTYVSRKSRAEVVRAAVTRGFPVRCIWLSTSVEEAQTNAAWRIVSRYGTLPGGAELERLRKRDVAAFLPTVQFRYQRELEAPDASEGFSRVDVVPVCATARSLVRQPRDHRLVRRRAASQPIGAPIAHESGGCRGSGGSSSHPRSASRRGLACARHVVAAGDRGGAAVLGKR